MLSNGSVFLFLGLIFLLPSSRLKDVAKKKSGWWPILLENWLRVWLFLILFGDNLKYLFICFLAAWLQHSLIELLAELGAIWSNLDKIQTVKVNVMACFCVNGTHDILLLIGEDRPHFSIHTDLIFHTYMADDGAETPKVLPNLDFYFALCCFRHFKPTWDLVLRFNL